VWWNLWISQVEKRNIEVAVATSGSGQKTEVRTLGRTGTKLICDWGWRLVSRRNEEHWAVGSSETKTKERKVHEVNCGDLEMRKREAPRETYRAERTAERPVVNEKPVRSAVTVRCESASGTG